MNRKTDGRTAASSFEAFPIVVHCHLQWEWVWQRPQQIFSRLAKRHPILFIETLPPSPDLNAPRIRRHHPIIENLTAAQVQFPCSLWSDGNFVDAQRRRLVQDLLSGPLLGKFDAPVQWFYDPMAVTAFAGHMNESAVVYDCMDELSQFNGAPDGIVEREKTLLALADVVFTGGLKLFESKRRHNPNCHFYGCGVELDHFSRALDPQLPVASDIENIPHPRLGYIGVIDERIDYSLLEGVADSRPDWHLVMVGPVAKVDPATLPRRANIHWMGGREYQQLPGYLKGFDVCLMPFALNKATEYINPTKALEYLATGRPVVSTAIADVVANFPPVAVAKDAGQFVALCEEAITAPSSERIEKGRALAGQNTWESIVAKMERHIVDALAAKASRPFQPEGLPELSHRGGLAPAGADGIRNAQDQDLCSTT